MTNIVLKNPIRLSLLCANYNNSQFLNEFFQSIIQSTIQPDEIIFVDDASTDNSVEITQRYQSKLNINLIQLKINGGVANAANAGLIHCNGEFTARIDPDDMLHPDRLALQLNEFNAHPELDAVGSQAQYFLSTTKKNLSSTNMPIESLKIKQAFYKGNNGLLHGTATIKTAFYKKYSYVQNEVPAEDYALFCRMIRDGANFKNIDKDLVLVRIHSNSVTNKIALRDIKKLFNIRKNTLNIDYSKASLYSRFLSLSSYRQYLFEQNKFKKLYYLSIACLFGPDRLMRRLFR